MRLIDADELKENLFIKFGNQLPNGLFDEIDNAPTVKTYCYFCGQTEHGQIEERPQTDILEQIIAEINTSNRGTCDYYIVDRIEEIINEYQKGGKEE